MYGALGLTSKCSLSFATVFTSIFYTELRISVVAF